MRSRQRPGASGSVETQRPSPCAMKVSAAASRAPSGRSASAVMAALSGTISASITTRPSAARRCGTACQPSAFEVSALPSQPLYFWLAT